jgi:hypothetical protein
VRSGRWENPREHVLSASESENGSSSHPLRPVLSKSNETATDPGKTWE